MMQLTLSEISNILNQIFQGKDRIIHNIVIDSRIVTAGDIFVAIKGENHDGHDFAAQAVAQGANAVIAERVLVDIGVPIFRVPNTRKALGQIASVYRQRFKIPIVAVTGSCGKTSTKTFIASVLSQQGKTLATEGTLNNDLGVPLTLFRLSTEHQFAVIEIGANHPGEIDALAKMTQPGVSVITNSGPVHLEGFGSIEGVQKAKGELYQNLTPEGIGIVNADDNGASYWINLLQGKRVIRFGLGHKAEVMAEDITLNEQLHASFHLKINQDIIWIQLPVIGTHQVPNALAAAAVGFSQGLNLKQIKTGLESAPTVAQRGIFQTGYNGCLIIDDSYNANPMAFVVAIDLLMAVPKIDQPIVVMGDMGELGTESSNLHANVGKIAKRAGVHAFYSIGKLSQAACEAFGSNAYCFENQEMLVAALKKIAAPTVCFLVKGSKSSHMGDVVAALG